ncbi:hypothetical protein F511_39544 [Dorcoceras hygrometricum]|uniref:Uncharacterized protein n=1 Tax=Dorcoceras hygrometricum TaxID=472368 RepID=A0A2Z7BVQ5_9LAMI|nr:hypothetical protein F511_39544 [Dorcoceras hygrometricum]
MHIQFSSRIQQLTLHRQRSNRLQLQRYQISSDLLIVTSPGKAVQLAQQFSSGISRQLTHQQIIPTIAHSKYSSSSSQLQTSSRRTTAFTQRWYPELFTYMLLSSKHLAE